MKSNRFPVPWPLFRLPGVGRVSRERFGTVLISAFVTLLACIAQAHPVLIPLRELPDLLGKPRAGLVAFSVSQSTPGGYLRNALPVQVDELTSRGSLVLRNPNYQTEERKRRGISPVDPDEGRFSLAHRLVFNDKHLSVCTGKCVNFAEEEGKRVCKKSNSSLSALVQIQLRRRGTSAFIAQCKDAASEARARREDSPVKVLLEERTLQSDLLRYRFSKNNHMLLDEFAIRQGGQGGSYVPLLARSEFHLHAKPKFFFPLHFDGNDVESQLIGYQSGPLSTTGELSFFLNILKFKIRLGLVSEVSIFEDAIHVPAIVSLPVSGNSLRAGSGVFYGFDFLPGNVEERIVTDMPPLQKPGTPIPFARVRTFLLAPPAPAAGTLIAVRIEMPGAFEDMKFSPALAKQADLERFGFPRTGTDFGVFWDITQLRKGEHRCSAWFFVGSEDEREILLDFAKNGVAYKIMNLSP